MKQFLSLFSITLFLFSCSENKEQIETNLNALTFSKNNLKYQITPKHEFDKEGLMFSDQGAWFAYSSPEDQSIAGFSGPFLLTQQNGVWASTALSELSIENVSWNSVKVTSYSSHLEQVFTSEGLQLTQRLVFVSGHTAMIQSELKNTSPEEHSISYHWKNQPILADSLSLSSTENQIKITSTKTNAVGYIRFPDAIQSCADNRYETQSKTITLKSNETESFVISHSFIFPEYSWEEERKALQQANFQQVLNQRKVQKNEQLQTLMDGLKTQFQDTIYREVLAKAQLTLQNNWRIPTGEIKHEGLFPSYHYKWFNGFWSWDSWKHAVGLSFYDTNLAKKQIKLLFEFQEADGFVPDVVYRDTKPPLSTWAVSKLFEKDADTAFVKYMYPKLKMYHNWWYQKRDHDQDGLCEYGSTDGSLIAAKWESGMDNAIRFDDSKILKNGEGAYSLDHESVDLNAYLCAEKLYLVKLAEVLDRVEEAKQFNKEASELKTKIQTQFYDAEDGWFFDTNLEGNKFIKGEGSEGWTALWAQAATSEQAESVKNRMMNPQKFYTKVPFQTMSADHPKFDPLKGYWRGPNWLDQAYFGVKALRNYGYNQEADRATVQILQGTEGLLEKGKSIRENYHPLTGEGLHAKNFSWSAAHIIMLLMKE